MRTFLISVILLLSLHWAPAQTFTAIATTWSDDFSEWTIFLDQEDGEGILKLRWPMQRDPTEWDFDVDGTRGEIRLKWKNDPGEWEIRSEGRLISARAIWANDIRHWRISDGTHKIVWKTRWGNSLEEWETEDDRFGYFRLYTAWKGDPRDWIIEDKLDSTLDTPFKMALVFLAVLHGIPN